MQGIILLDSVYQIAQAESDSEISPGGTNMTEVIQKWRVKSNYIYTKRAYESTFSMNIVTFHMSFLYHFCHICTRNYR